LFVACFPPVTSLFRGAEFPVLRAGNFAARLAGKSGLLRIEHVERPLKKSIFPVNTLITGKTGESG
jgi:hypothetical protein